MSIMRGIATLDDLSSRPGLESGGSLEEGQPLRRATPGYIGGPMQLAAPSRRTTRRRPFRQAHPMTMTEAGQYAVSRLDRLVPPGIVTRAPARGRPLPTPLLDRRWAGESREVA